MFTEEQKRILLKLARDTIENYILKGIIPKFESDVPEFNQNAGAFVTLYKKGELRGCIGIIESNGKLCETIMEMAIEAARNDPRFLPVNEYELNELDIEISVLSKPKKINSIDDIELGRHGVIVKKGFASGVFLPQVAKETGWTKEEFLRHLCKDKAGLSEEAFRDKNTEIYVFEAEVFGEKKS